MLLRVFLGPRGAFSELGGEIEPKSIRTLAGRKILKTTAPSLTPRSAFTPRSRLPSCPACGKHRDPLDISPAHAQVSTAGSPTVGVREGGRRRPEDQEFFEDSWKNYKMCPQHFKHTSFNKKTCIYIYIYTRIFGPRFARPRFFLVPDTKYLLTLTWYLIPSTW